MAQNPACMIEDCATPATFIGTFFDTGDSIKVCGDHFVEFMAGTLEAITGIPVTMLITLPPETFAGGDTPPEIVAPNDGPTSDESSDHGTADDLLAEIKDDDEFYREHKTLVDEHMEDGLDFDSAIEEARAIVTRNADADANTRTSN